MPIDLRRDFSRAAALAAFFQLAGDAAHGPDTDARLTLARLAAAELEGLAHLGASDLGPLEEQVARAVTEFGRRTQTQDFAERLVRTYVAFNITRDLRRHVAGAGAGGASAQEDYVVARLGAHIADDPQLAARLALWGRRVLGETLAVVRHFLSDHPGLIEGEDPDAVLAALTRAHTRRMARLALAS